MTWKYDNVGDLYDILGLHNVSMQPKRTRYYSNGEYYDGILIAYNMDENYQVTDTFLDVSGKGCRTIEQLNPGFNWFVFLNRYDAGIRDRSVHVSRIDIACDVLDGSVTIEQVQKHTRAELYVCKSKVLPDVRYMRSMEVYFGSPKSDRLLRIYDKALEQGIPDTNWLRLEFQLRNDNATSWYLNWCQHKDVGKLYSGVMLDFLRFVSPLKGTSIKDVKADRHQGRLPTAPWWERFIGDVERIPQLYLPGEEYTLVHLERYLEKQSYSSLKTYIIAHDRDISKLLDGIKHCTLNAKQRLLLANLYKDKDVKIDYELNNFEIT